MNASPRIKLDELLQGFVLSRVDKNPMITGLAVDSRIVKSGDLFFACRGVNVDGTQYIQRAIDAGAAAVVVDASSIDIANSDYAVPVCAVRNLSQKLGDIASRYYGKPTEHLHVVGITGTNGKTSCSHILAQCLNELGICCGVIGTLGAGVWGRLSALQNTTPGAVELQKLFSELRNENAKVISMEVSSHGLEQHRVAGCHFDIAVFTNLSRDHLDYHGDMATYGASKLKLFTDYAVQKVVVNLDDDFASQIINNLPNDVKVIGTALTANNPTSALSLLRGQIVKADRTGTVVKVECEQGWGEFRSSLLGDFNMSNLLNVLATLLLLDVPLKKALNALESAKAPNGRLETFFNAQSPLVVVDYAHTPDALEKALITLKHHTKGQLLLLFGCGGDRDRGKRAEMGRAAKQHADVVWITNDNPRTEDPSQIVRDILLGVADEENVVVELDRAKAIKSIINAASQDDVVLIAGKGHEDYQVIGMINYDFSDREIVAEIIGVAA